MRILNQNVTGLVDSGASASTCHSMGANLLKAIGFKLIKANIPATGILADGSNTQLKHFFSVPVDFENKLIIVNFYVLESSPRKFTFGMDLINKFQLNLSCKENNWSFSVNSECDKNKIIDSQELNPNQKTQLANIIKKFNCLSTGKLGKSRLFEHTINTGNAQPVFQRAYPVSPPLQKRMSNELDRMISLGVVEPSNSPWCSLPVLTTKKNGKDRLCINCKKLNNVTVKSKYALPRIDTILSRLGEAHYISSIDLNDAFWQIPLDSESRPKTAFNIPGRGMWQFKVVPFGLTTSAQAMQRLMDYLFNEEGEFIYIDDIIIVSKTFSDHIQALNRVFNKLKNAGLTVNIEKCNFCRPSLKYLGYVVDRYGLRTDIEKISCIANYDLPTNLKELRRFIGMTSYYRRFIKSFAHIAAPLNDLTKSKSKIIKWNDKAIEAFDNLKTAMIQAPVLATPDFEKPFIVQCDASDLAISGVLVQKDPETNEEKPIAFASRKLRGAELNYTTTEKECLAVIFSIEKFKQYIEGLQFEVITDHSALLWLLKQQDLKGRLARWVLLIQQYDFDIKHIKGKNNVVPDAISRFPVENLALVDIVLNKQDVWYIGLKENVKNNPKKFPNFKIVNDKLFMKSNKVVNNTEFDYKLVVPESMRRSILKECHDSPLSSHLGTFKTIKRVLQKYYWPGVARDVKEYVKNCSICLQSKPQSKQQYGKMGKMKISNRPWETISMDFMGPFPRSTKGNEYLFVICDHFTKYCILVPMRNAKANKVIEIVEKQVFLTHGVPRTIICDNGKQFISKEFKKLAKEYKVTQIFYNCVYHPQNNPTERTNKVIGAAIRSYINDNHKHWDKELDKIQCALRKAVNVVTGYTPFYLNHGRELITSGSDYLLCDVNNEKEEINRNEIDVATEKLNKLNVIADDITKRMIRAYKINKKYYDASKVDFNFKVGDKVQRKNFVLSNAAKNISAKLCKPFINATVKEKISDLVYLLVDDDTGHEQEFHIRHIKNT